MASQTGTERDAQLGEVDGEPTDPPGETLGFSFGITSDLSSDLTTSPGSSILEGNSTVSSRVGPRG